VQEPLLLVNRSSCRSDISTLPGSLARLDRGHLDAERAHPLAFDAVTRA